VVIQWRFCDGFNSEWWRKGEYTCCFGHCNEFSINLINLIHDFVLFSIDVVLWCILFHIFCLDFK
jgi:hypothetical protein